ncbi:regulator of ribosome biosynthesis [Nematocida sp. AWRm77]|nr:regulator of ribosome biosynthesis [Nematocida sp. AWRm77]
MSTYRTETVQDTKSFISIRERKEEDRMDSYKDMVREFFQELKKCPTKYDLYKSPQYILPKEVLPHEKAYSKETVFPRSRVLPEDRVKTRWELFAERRGIVKNKNKKGGRIYNEETREYTPAYGRGSKNDLDRHWIIEVKEHEDPLIDRHDLLKKNKKENKKRQESHEHRNLKRKDALPRFQKHWAQEEI